MNFGNPASKYGNKKVEVDGIIFDSKKESKKYLELKAMKAAGEIRDFEIQKTFELIPAQKAIKTVIVNGKPVTKERVVERACTWTADFVVTDNDGDIEVIDTKGNKSLDQKWPIKRKLMRYVHGIAVQEV